MNRDAHILTMMAGLFHELTKAQDENRELRTRLAQSEKNCDHYYRQNLDLARQLGQSRELRVFDANTINEMGDCIQQLRAEKRELEIRLGESEAANQNYREAIDRLGPKLEPMERDAVIAGLRLLQERRNHLHPDLYEIYTNGRTHTGMDLEEIDVLCERLNT